MTYAEATEFLFGLRRFGWRPGLATVERLLALVGDPQAGLPCVHVGGSNGKGSTAAMLDAMCRAAGRRTGLYSSPHLLSFTERIRVDGAPIGEAEIVALTERLETVASAHFASETTEPPDGCLPHPTFFELTTVMAFLHFRQQAVNAAVIEVGLGGRLDATNVIRPRVAVITNIALEHQEYLGTTLAEIAREKAGIIKTGVPVVTGARGEALEVISETAGRLGAPLTVVPESYHWTVRASGFAGQTFDLRGPRREYEGLRIPLAGRHQVENAVLAVAVAETLDEQGIPLDETAIRRGLTEVEWPGRLQVVRERPRIVLDGAHNPAGTEALAAFLAERRAETRRLILVFGVLQDKDWKAMLGRLAPLADEIILTRPPTARAADPAELLPVARRFARAIAVLDPAEALQLARVTARAEDTILVTGSLYTVAAVLRILRPTA
ncbi:MAG TPA: folylpolyglutamate synthase/dihydrofolate synthase family protein [Candidatus Methylomirabilis sp.]